MLTSVLLVLVIVAFIAIGLIAWALLLGLGLRWAKASEWTWRRAAATTVVVNIASTAYMLFALRLIDQPTEHKLAAATLFLVGYFVFTVGIVSWSFRLSILRAFQAWLPTLLSGLVGAALSILLVRPLLFEPYVIPTNSMAPTLLGWHGRDTCATCGGTCYFTPPPGHVRHVPPLPMICDQFHVTHKQPSSSETFIPTRIAVAKFLRPKRWDLIVFDLPSNPQEVYVKRVVGLPGETVVIENGRVLINGKEVEMPEELKGLEYLTEMLTDGPYPRPIRAGSAEHPAQLADDEYFVLGDFSINAYDARLWEQGAEGHPPYAVPHSHVRGVVSHIVWPPERLRVLR